MKHVRSVVVVAAVMAAAATGCGSPSSKRTTADDGRSAIATDKVIMDRDAKGPAKDAPGARKGGTITVYSQPTPNTFDPTDTYYVDANEIDKLIFRTPTQFDIRPNGDAVLVSDLTDLGTVSADKLTWTFRFQRGIKYADGSEVKVEDLAYAIKRSFAHDVYPNGPTYHMTYFKDGDPTKPGAYKGPYTSGDTYAGVETPDPGTLVIHLAQPFPDLPFYLSYPLFTPIPKAKDTRQDYKNKPMATGPYEFDSYTPGAQLKLKRNPHWDANTDPARHQYVDGWDFKFGEQDVKTQQQVLNSNGADANALNYQNIDASLVPQLTGAKAGQLLRGASPCHQMTQLDSRKIPLEVRKAIAVAYPYDQLWKASGFNDYGQQASSTIMPPSVPGYRAYQPLPGLSGKGAGDPAAAKKMLTDAGKLSFEVSWYYDNTKPLTQQTTQILSDALTAAGFTAKPIGVSTAELRGKIGDYNAPTNLGASPSGWCSDWPSGSSWFPVLFQTHSIADGQSIGMLSDKDLDARINAIAALPPDEAVGKWADLDREIMSRYVVLPRYYYKVAVVIGTNIGGALVDSTMGMPNYKSMFLKG
ncbi:ABC transporter substrate-binding protein [Dactylosporangium sp. NPDC049742]|uniref:ABC transporter substrate-binding protein n=1 Tax=Dactylosporangium sp. NPDC049742 TaxID=3154737 RepID=UPI003426A623